MNSRHQSGLFWLLFIFLTCFITELLHAQDKRPDSLQIYFSFNDFSINKTAMARLNAFLGSVDFRDTTLISIVVTGHADTAGTETYNQVLSLKRCRSVNELVRRILQGGQNPRILLRAMGEQGAASRADSLDRRVVLVLHYRRAGSTPVSVSQKQEPIQEEKRTPAKTQLQPEKTRLQYPSPKERVADTVIVLDNIYFEPDLPILTPGSMSAIPHYVSVLKKYRDRDMEVGGHVNHTDSKLKETDPLFKLSEKRAEIIYEYLIDNGFDAAKITHRGYGNAKLLFANPQNEGEKRKNMRVEITVFVSPEAGAAIPE